MDIEFLDPTPYGVTANPPLASSEPAIKRRPLRIAILAWESLYTHAIGPASTYATNLCQELAARGHEVHAYVRLSSSAPEHQFPNYELVNQVHVHRIRTQPIQEASSSPTNSLNPNLEKIPQLCADMVYFLAETEQFMNADFDVIHAIDWMMCPAVINIKVNTFKKCVLHLLSIEGTRNVGNVLKYGSQVEKIKEWENEGMKHADLIVTASSALCDDIKANYIMDPMKLRKVPQAVDCKVYDDYVSRCPPLHRESVRKSILHCSQGDEVVFLFHGLVNEAKGCDIVFDTILNMFMVAKEEMEKNKVPLNQRKAPKFRLVIYGEGPLKQEMMLRAEHYRIMNKLVYFCGPSGCTDLYSSVPLSVPNAKAAAVSKLSLLDLYHACDVVIAPSRSESTQAAVLSAWAAKKPVLTSDVKAFLDLVHVGHDGLIVEANGIGVGWGINQYLNMRTENIVQMGEAGRVIAAFEYSWVKVTDYILGVYYELGLNDFATETIGDSL
eukprot:CAMPEP_0184696416 /NCGR_PEP_ID=MMETSP0313-20130426/3724_1 /TAXON_ID=2792 /ORGANISM="Porphyridium aerugineum, Strain SAG 1380-2" /LENGTH=496 /DNA_ID=CAMNT_0027155043 /DNA_START=79 /DNA_END=1566 /DNA_ORIENTATION=+